MLFHKSIVSFVAAIALASSVTASATPGPARLKRAGPPSCPNGGNPTCCSSISGFGSLPQDVQTALTNADPSLNKNLNVGLSCNLAGSQACNNKGLCCAAVVNLNLPVAGAQVDNAAPDCTSPA